jgi:PAS domain S-box-containing protein
MSLINMPRLRMRDSLKSEASCSAELDLLYRRARLRLCRLDPEFRIERIAPELASLCSGPLPANEGVSFDDAWPAIAGDVRRAAARALATGRPQKDIAVPASASPGLAGVAGLFFNLFPIFEDDRFCGYSLIFETGTGDGALREEGETPPSRPKTFPVEQADFRSLLDMTSTPIALCDVDEVIHYINPCFTQTFGYELDDIPTLSKWFHLAYPDENYRRAVYEEWEENVRRVYSRRMEAPTMEARIRCKNAEDRMAIIGVNFLEDWSVLIATFFDVTEQRASEKKIKRLSRLYAALSGCQEAIIRAVSRDEIFSRVCEVMFEEGVAKLAWVGLVDNAATIVRCAYASGQGMAYLRDIRISLDPDDPHGLGPSGRAAREGYPVWCQDFLNDPSTAPWRDRGRMFGWASSASLPLREKGRVIGVLTLYFNETSYFDVEMQSLLLKISASISFALDALSEQSTKEAQETLLRKSEERYRRIVETSLEGIWLIDAQARTSFVNPRMAAMLSYDAAEMLGRPLTDFLQDSATRIVSGLENSEGAPQDVRFRRKDGSDLWALLSWRAIYEEGVYAGALAMVMDFTERRRLQEQIESQMHLLEEADRHKNEFLATLAHELRNPLATINLVTERVEAHLETGMGDRQEDRAALKRAIRQGKHLARLVDELVQVSRITTGKIDLHREIVDLVTFLPEAAEVIEPKMSQRNIDFVTFMPQTPLPVSGDPVRLTQVFGNLLDNAVKFTDPGGRIELRASRDGASALIIVRDNGRGIPSDQLHSIFGLFQQMKHGTERKAEGLGIGLALARQLVELHGGVIDAKSDGLGKGAVFTVMLPLAAEDVRLCDDALTA